MLTIIVVVLVLAGLSLAKILVLLPLGTLTLFHMPTWLSWLLLLGIAAWVLGD